MSIFSGGGYCEAGRDPHSTRSEHYASIPSAKYTRGFRSHLDYTILALVPALHRGSNNNRTSYKV